MVKAKRDKQVELLTEEHIPKARVLVVLDEYMPRGWRAHEPDSNVSSDNREAIDTEGDSDISEPKVSDVARRFSCMAASVGVASKSDEELIFLPREVANLA